jgi:hypothetical protein
MRMERYDNTHALRKFRAANRLTSSARVFEATFVNFKPVIMIKQIPRRFDEALSMWGGLLFMILKPMLAGVCQSLCSFLTTWGRRRGLSGSGMNSL